MRSPSQEKMVWVGLPGLTNKSTVIGVDELTTKSQALLADPIWVNHRTSAGTARESYGLSAGLELRSCDAVPIRGVLRLVEANTTFGPSHSESQHHPDFPVTQTNLNPLFSWSGLNWVLMPVFIWLSHSPNGVEMQVTEVCKRACQWTALPTAVLRSMKQNLEYSECETEPKNTDRAGDWRGDLGRWWKESL